MCLILFAINPDTNHRLVVAANRDELFARPTRPAGFWDSNPDVLAGTDLNMGGTWLGVNRAGAFAAVTNFREEPPDPLPPRSRGDLPRDFLINHPHPAEYVRQVNEIGTAYRGFNLIVADDSGCHYVSNRSAQPRELAPGFYGLSNQLLDCDWPKVIEGRRRLTAMDFGAESLPEQLFSLLTDDGDNREFSNSFIRGDTYGTRAATVVLISNRGEVYFEERNFDENAQSLETNQYRFTTRS